MGDWWYACEHPERPPVKGVTTFHWPEVGCHGCYTVLPLSLRHALTSR